MKRLLVIALQEATRDLIDPWVQQGLLPNIAALMQAGTSGRVHAQAPLTTPHNWANILTGVNAGQHGVFDYWQRGTDGIFRETSPAMLKAPPIWERLRGTGLRSTFVNLPMTWPLPEVDGTVVAGEIGLGAVPTSKMFAPRDLHDQLVARHGPYRPGATAPGGRKKHEYISLFDNETPHTTAAFEFLLNAQHWDFAMVYFIDAAMAQHYFWADMEDGSSGPYSGIVASAYKNLDAAIGRFMAAAGPDTVIFLISECGAGPIRSGINLTNWLEQQGLLRTRHSSLTVLKHFIENNILPSAKRILPLAVKSAIGNRSRALRNWASSSGTQLDLDWSQTKIFSRGKEGNLFVNLAGRDPQGIVQPGKEYDELLNYVEDALCRLQDPNTGARVVTSVARPEELYAGPAVEFAPDLIIDWSDAAYMMTERGRSGSDVFVERWRKGMSWPTSGSHRYDGVLIAAGPGVSAGEELGLASQFDLLPTWLNILGQPVPSDLEGRVLTEIMES